MTYPSGIILSCSLPIVETTDQTLKAWGTRLNRTATKALSLILQESNLIVFAIKIPGSLQCFKGCSSRSF